MCLLDPVHESYSSTWIKLNLNYNIFHTRSWASSARTWSCTHFRRYRKSTVSEPLHNRWGTPQPHSPLFPFAPETCKTKWAPRTRACHNWTHASCKCWHTVGHRSRRWDEPHANKIRDTCECSGSAFGWCGPMLFRLPWRMFWRKKNIILIDYNLPHPVRRSAASFRT